MPKTPDEIATEEADQKRHREELAKQANKDRNQLMLDRRNAIADSADRKKEEEEDLVDMTDEEWAKAEANNQDEPPPKRKQKEERRVAKEEDEDATLEETEGDRRVRRAAEREDRELDEARDAGADDIRKREDGTVEYRLVKNREERWLTLAELREQAGETEVLQDDEEGDRTAPARVLSPTDAERRAAAEQARQERRTKFIDLQTRASMGDEQAISELADVLSGVTEATENLDNRVIQTVDARVKGTSNFEKAVDWFEDEYEAELSSPRLKKMAARLDLEYAKASPDLAPRDRLKKVGEELRAIRRELTGEKRDDSDSPPARDKLDRKRDAAPIRRASGRPRQEQEADEQGTTKDAIQQLARGRGQTRAISH